jgi:tetratricopeptide (TPR) repeat protein
VSDRLDPARLDALWDFADPDGSAQRFRAEQAVAPPVAVAELATQLARALGLAGRADEAHAVLDEIVPDDPVVGIRVALERGRLANSSGRPAEAVTHFAIALELAEQQHEHFLAVDAAHMLAIADEEHSGQWAARGIQLVDAATDARTKRWAIALHNNLGWTHHDAGLFPEAFEEFELADAAARAHGTDEQRQLAEWAIARCLRSLGRTAEALEIQQRLIVLRPDDEFVIDELAKLRAAQ